MPTASLTELGKASTDAREAVKQFPELGNQAIALVSALIDVMRENEMSREDALAWLEFAVAARPDWSTTFADAVLTETLEAAVAD